MRIVVFCTLVLVLSTGKVWCQPIDHAPIAIDTLTITENDTLQIKDHSKRFDPRKALLYAAIFPGAGQFYNKKYWKIPLVYGGFAGLISVANFYDKFNREFKDEFYYLVNNPSLKLSPAGRSKEQLRIAIDKSRRERDYFIILSGLFYILQMVDAHVDAHLKEFDLNPKMQVRLEPMIDNSLLTGRTSGIALKLRF